MKIKQEKYKGAESKMCKIWASEPKVLSVIHYNETSCNGSIDVASKWSVGYDPV